MSKTALFIQHQRLAPPAMLGDAFAEAGYDNELLLVETTAVNIEFLNRATSMSSSPWAAPCPRMNPRYCRPGSAPK